MSLAGAISAALISTVFARGTWKEMVHVITSGGLLCAVFGVLHNYLTPWRTVHA